MPRTLALWIAFTTSGAVFALVMFGMVTALIVQGD